MLILTTMAMAWELWMIPIRTIYGYVPSQ
jgi:hypothetical protein